MVPLAQYMLIFIIYSIISQFTHCEDIRDLTKHPGHLKRYGSQGEFKLVEEIYHFPPPSEFFDGYVGRNVPVLMRGVIADSKPCTDWTDEYFLQLPIPANETVKIQGDNGPLDDIKMHFHEFVRTYNETNDYMETTVPGLLGKDVVIPTPLQCEEVFKMLDFAQLWFTKGGTRSVVHIDGADNIICMYAGQKEVTLLHPDQYLNKAGIDPKEVGLSYMDVERVDYTKHPDLANIEFYHKAHMTAGDCLYIPYNWIHQVFSYNRNLAINIWWYPAKEVSDVVTKCKDIPKLNFTVTEKSHGRPERGYLPAAQIKYFIDDMTKDQPASVDDLTTLFLDLLIVGSYYVKIFREPGESANKINVGRYSEEHMNRFRSHPDVMSQYSRLVTPSIAAMDQNKDGFVSKAEFTSEFTQKRIMPNLYKKARPIEKLIRKLVSLWAKEGKPARSPDPAVKPEPLFSTKTTTARRIEL